MRKIEIVEKPCDEAIYEIDKFAFKFGDNDVGRMIKYQVDLEIKGGQPIDVRLLLQDMDSELEFLLPAPEEVTKLINEVDEKNDPSDECLFHDLRTKYIEFIKCATDTPTNVNEEIILLGFSLHDEKIYLVMKTFSFNALAAFWEKLISYCTNKSIMFNVPDDIRWIKLQQYLLQTNETKPNGVSRDFLARTLVEDNFSRFLQIFRQIDTEGYFGKSFYDRVMYRSKKINEKKEIRVPINQVNKFFAPYWKYQISTAEKNKTVLCLHDEMPSDETVEEYVYTFKPSLMKYYLQSWFEDFTVEIIKRIKFDEVQLRQLLAGKKFNFFLDGSDDNVREIDAVIELEKDGIVKLIAIECKKTLSLKEIQTTNKKCREKVVDSGNNVFDAFIHIGCFNKDVEFDKRIERTKREYKQSLIEGTGENMDVPYYAFVITTIADYETAAKTIIREEYPHIYFEIEKRTYTMIQKMNQFIRDGFIDRYTGKRLLNPGILKIISYYFPNEFPYHPHWKMTQTHIAYWELIPTVDHIYPIAQGGQDDEKNWVTTSMKNNSIKSNYTIDEIHWKLYPKGDIADWDGLTSIFLKLVDKDKELLKDGYIKSWYNVSQKCLYNKDYN